VGCVTQSNAIGIFEDSIDIGTVERPGASVLNDGTYRVSGAGTNMWFDRDEFHFVWTRVSADNFTLSADIHFPSAGVDAHRKAALVIRESLDPLAAYADIALHGDGLVSLQYRKQTGAITREVQSASVGATRVAIVRRGDRVHAIVDGKPSGGSVKLAGDRTVYVGLAVCSHNPSVTEVADFSNVELAVDEAEGHDLYSSLETIDIESTDRRTTRVFDRWIEAPNWTNDGRLIVNGDGRLWAVPADGGDEIEIDTGSAIGCNNDHGLSPDGRWIVISDQSEGESVIRILPSGGGTPRTVTESAPSYWHGWSPDGTTLAYCAKRDGLWGIFTISVEGGAETRITTAPGLDDGPDYSPDGAFIYFNSDRTGRMQIHRVKTDGTGLERVIETDTADWFPHISPNGRWLAFVAYDGDVEGHPRDKDVTLQLMNVEDGSVRTIAELFGGQGTMNVPSWAPDSSRLAFVSYAYL
jgi:TolB protein